MGGMKIRMDYGSDGLEIDLPETATVLSMRDTPGLKEIDRQIEASLVNPIGSPGLRELVRGCGDACIVISDITRPVPNNVILPPILRVLEEEGIAREDIVILIGTGLHRPNEGDELNRLVGPEISRKYRVINHLAREKQTLTYVGDTSGGAPIWIDSVYLQAELKIATSLIEPHLMAGDSGGRKAICPGLMGVETMKVLHGPKLLANTNCSEGKIRNNPFHHQALEVARRVGVDFTLNVSMNERREITGVFAGDLEAAHAAGVEFVESQNGATLQGKADVVITSGAGAPLDSTFYQSIKGLTAVLPIIAEGGTIIIVASCDEGIGSREFEELLLSTDSPEDFLQQLEDPDFFVVDQWQLQELCKVLKKARVMMYSNGIPDELSDKLLLELIESVDCGLADALSNSEGKARIAVVPKGPYVLTKLRE